MSLCEKCEHFVAAAAWDSLLYVPACKKHEPHPGCKTLCTEFRRKERRK